MLAATRLPDSASLHPVTLTFALFALLSFTPAPQRTEGIDSDRVVLKSGKELVGHVVFEDEERLVLRRGTKDREIEQGKIDEVESRARAIRTLVEEMVQFDPWRPSDNEQLALRASELGLDPEARVLWWRVLAHEPDNVAAHEALGHKKAGKSWRILHAGRRVRMDKVRDIATDFGKAWEFSTSHFDLRSNLPLEQVLDLAIDLERLYVGFYGLFGKELELYETEDRMMVQVHADSASFPERAGEDGYFVGQTNLLTVNASRGLSMHLIAHEATHQLIFNTAVEERRYKGAIPSWANEGIAEYVASMAGGSHPGRLTLNAEQLRRDAFQRQASARKPLSLSRVLNLGDSDFNASTNRELKYAQVYTLVHFCLHGEDERYRDMFLSFMRSAYLGQGSATDFKRTFGLKKNRDFEGEWRGYVLQRAG